MTRSRKANKWDSQFYKDVELLHKAWPEIQKRVMLKFPNAVLQPGNHWIKVSYKDPNLEHPEIDNPPLFEKTVLPILQETDQAVTDLVRAYHGYDIIPGDGAYVEIYNSSDDMDSEFGPPPGDDDDDGGDDPPPTQPTPPGGNQLRQPAQKQPAQKQLQISASRLKRSRMLQAANGQSQWEQTPRLRDNYELAPLNEDGTPQDEGAIYSDPLGNPEWIRPRKRSQSIPNQISPQGVPMMAKKIQFGGRRRANPNNMTGGGKPSTLEDKGNSSDNHTMLGIPMGGHDSALDDDQQPTGSGAPATTIPGAPLKSPMKATDVARPKLREGVEANLLRKAAVDIRKVAPHLARRLMVVAGELGRRASDDLSTAELELDGSDPSNDDTQDNLGHGTLAFFGTDAARADQLTAKKAGKIAAGRVNLQQMKSRIEGIFNKLISEAQAANPGIDLNPQGDMGFLSAEIVQAQGSFDQDLPEGENGQALLVHHQGDALSSVTAIYTDKYYCDVSGEHGMDDYLGIGSRLGQGEKISPARFIEAFTQYEKAWIDQIVDWEKQQANRRPQTPTPKTPANPSHPDLQPSASRRVKRKATPTAWNNETPEAQDPAEDAPPAQGTGGFATDSSKPLMDTTNAGDVTTPTIRDASDRSATAVLVNPKGKVVAKGGITSLKAAAERAVKAGKIASLEKWSIKPVQKKSRKASQELNISTWNSLKKAFKTMGETGGSHNGGRFAATIHDYGKTLEVEAVAHDREGIPRTAGILSLTLVHDAPEGRFATVEVNDGVIENRSTQQTLRTVHASAFAEQWLNAVAGTARELLTH